MPLCGKRAVLGWLGCAWVAAQLLGWPGISARAAEPASAGPTGALSGRLTDLRSSPLAGVTVILRSQSTGVEVVRAVTGRNGVYRFTGIAPGVYTLEARSGRLGRGELADIEVAAGHEARMQAAMSLVPPAEAAPQLAADPRLPDAPREAAAPQLDPVAAMIAAVAMRARDGIGPADIGAGGDDEIQPMPLRSQALASRGLAAPAALLSPAPVEISAALQPVQAAPQQIAALHLPAQPSAGLRSSLHAAGPPAADSTPSLIRSVVAAVAGLPSSNSAAAALAEVPPATAAASTTIAGEQLRSLPVSGRRWQQLFLDTPAAAAEPSSAQASFLGLGQNPADATIDGASVRMAFGSAAGSAAGLSAQDPSAQSSEARVANQGWAGGHGAMVSEAAIRNVEIEAGNAEARGAHAEGGRAGVETESGGNTLHGQGFVFDRQNSWGARNPFTQWVQNTGTAASPAFASVPYTPPDHESVWGFGAGSSIRRNRLFWFAALDGYRRNDPGVASVKQFAELFAPVEPTSAQVQLLSAQLGESADQAYEDYMGIPRAGVVSAGLEQLAALLGRAPRMAAQWTGFARLDWQAAERYRFTLEGIGSAWNSPGGGLTRVSEDYGSHSFGSSKASRQWLMARWEAFVTPNLLAVTQGSAGREILAARPDAPSSWEQTFLSGSSGGQLPQIVVDSRYGFTIGNPARFGPGSYPDERMMHGQQMLDWVHGRLLVKTGFELDHNTDAITLLRNRTGTYYYSKVQNFISDASVFERFGAANLLSFQNPHNCNATRKSFGALPCYSYYSQTMGPDYWQLSTNDWSGYITAQWQPGRFAVVSAALRWDREQLPAPMKLVDNPALPLTERLPDLGNEWGPRVSFALGNRRHWPLLRLGYGIYYGRTENATVQTAISQTGSLKGDLYFFIRPTDGYNPATGTSAAPPFSTVLTGPPGSVVTPGAVEYAPNFRNAEVHQAIASLEQALPGRLELTASALLSLGRRLPVSIDTNFDPAVNPGAITYAVKDPTGQGPIRTPTITVPFYALWPSTSCAATSLLTIAGQCGRLNPDYQQITQIMSRANSTYEAAMLRITRYGRGGLTLHAHYTYAHAMDWNPNGSTTVAGSDVLDPERFGEEYGTSDLDVRHSLAAMMIYEPRWKVRHWAGGIANGWMLSAVGLMRSGLPYTMRTTGSIPEEFDTFGNPSIVGIGPGMNGSGGDNRVYGVGRNTFRYPGAWKADIRLGKSFSVGEARELELMAESYNLFNHQNVTEIDTTGYSIESGGSTGTLPTLCYLTVNDATGGASCQSGTAAATTPLIPAFGQALGIDGTNFYRERQVQLGARFRF
jgi:hypothetical protein